MKAAHTPGPWELDPGDQGDPSVGMAGYAPNIFVEHTRGDGEVVVVLLAELREPYYDNDKEGNAVALGDGGANGRVMAAAPELLESARIDQALQMRGYVVATARALGEDAENAYLRAGPGGLRDWARRKREAAIAKAEGR